MITDADIKKLKKSFPTKDDLKSELEKIRKEIVKDVTDYLQGHVIGILNEHEARLDRIEKTVGGFPPLTD